MSVNRHAPRGGGGTKDGRPGRTWVLSPARTAAAARARRAEVPLAAWHAPDHSCVRHRAPVVCRKKYYTYERSAVTQEPPSAVRPAGNEAQLRSSSRSSRRHAATIALVSGQRGSEQRFIPCGAVTFFAHPMPAGIVGSQRGITASGGSVSNRWNRRLRAMVAVPARSIARAASNVFPQSSCRGDRTQQQQITGHAAHGAHGNMAHLRNPHACGGMSRFA